MPGVSAAGRMQAGKAHGLSDQAGFLILGNGLSRAVRFLGGLFLPYLMLQQDYGAYQQVWVLYSLFEQCLRMGFSESLIYHYPRYEGRERAGMVWQLAGVLLALGAVFAAVLAAGAPLAAAFFHTPSLAVDLRIFAVYALLAFPTLYLNSLLISAGRARTLAVLAFALTAVETAAVVLPLLAGWGLRAVLAGLAGAAALRFAVTAVMTWRVEGAGRADLAVLRATARFALPLGVPKVMGIVGHHLDRLIMGVYLPTAAFAVYGRGATRIPFVPIVASSALSVVQVGLAERWKDRDVHGFLDLWHESIRKVGLFILPVFFFLAVFAVPLFRWVFPPAYAAGAWVFWAHLWLLPLQLTAMSHVLVLLGRPGLVTACYAINLPLQLGLLLASAHFLMPVVGIAAPAGALVLSHWVGFGVALYFVRGRLGVAAARVFPWTELASIVRWNLAAAGAGMAGMLLASGVAWPGARLAGPAAFAGVLAAGFFPGGLLRRGDRELLARWMGAFRRPASSRGHAACPGTIPPPEKRNAA